MEKREKEKYSGMNGETRKRIKKKKSKRKMNEKEGNVTKEIHQNE